MLDRLYVLPSYQGQGVGKSLLESVIEHFKGLKEMFVDVEELNKGAIEFYKRQGFSAYDDSEELIGGKKFKVIEMIRRF
jgi:ribosomal protein S18 acetylase RimI-like enzyme